jgi:hypothetical protein
LSPVGCFSAKPTSGCSNEAIDFHFAAVAKVTNPMICGKIIHIISVIEISENRNNTHPKAATSALYGFLKINLGPRSNKPNARMLRTRKIPQITVSMMSRCTPEGITRDSGIQDVKAFAI